MGVMRSCDYYILVTDRTMVFAYFDFLNTLGTKPYNIIRVGCKIEISRDYNDTIVYVHKENYIKFWNITAWFG